MPNIKKYPRVLQFQLSAQMDDTLREIAALSERSFAEIIRSALNEYFKSFDGA